MSLSKHADRFYLLFLLLAFVCVFRLTDLTSTVWKNIGIITYDFSKTDFSQHDLDRALFYFQKANEENYAHPSTFRYLGHVLYELDREEDKDHKAIQYLTLASEFEPDNPQIHYVLGSAFLDLGEYQEALVPLKTALALDNMNRDYWYRLGEVYAGLLLFDKAIMAWEQGLLSPNNEEVGISNIYYQIGFTKQYLQRPTDLNSALFAYEKALIADDFIIDMWQQSDLHYQQGTILLTGQKVEQAISEFERAVTLNPEHYLSHVVLGKAFLQNGKFDEAEDILLIAIEKNAGNKLAYQVLAKLYQDSNQLEKARLMYEGIVLIDPTDEDARLALISIEELGIGE